MTKIMIPSFGWIYLHVMIDWGTKKLLSCQACSELGILQIFASCSNLKGGCRYRTGHQNDQEGFSLNRRI